MLLSGSSLAHHELEGPTCEDRKPGSSARDTNPIGRPAVPWLAATALVFCLAGIFLALLAAPRVTAPGEIYRIAFVHIPASWTSMVTYTAIALAANAGHVFGARIAVMTARALAPTGAMFTILSLWTGCLWSRPILGAWWIWDLEHCSELALMLFYAAFIALHAVMSDRRHAESAGAWLTLAGLPCVIIQFTSARSWTIEHAGASLNLAADLTLGSIALTGVLTMTVGFLAYAGTVCLFRLRCLILEEACLGDRVTQM